MRFRNKTNGEVIEAEESMITLFRTQPHLIELAEEKPEGDSDDKDTLDTSEDKDAANEEEQNQPNNDNEEISDSPAPVVSGGKRKRAA